MTNFEYYIPTKVFFGKDEEKNVGKILEAYNFKKVLLVYGKSSIKKNGLYNRITDALNASKIDFYELEGIEPNPKLEIVKKGIKIVQKNKIELILAVGGGSVIDTAKSISVGSVVDFDPFKFNKHEMKPSASLKVGVILTISAAGSEMSSSCVITNEVTKEKRGFNSDFNRPLFAICNPELTYSVSKYQTACGIVDIMMHTLERYFAKDQDSSLTDSLALGLLKNTVEAGKIAITNPTDYNSRKTLMWASSLSHNGLTGIDKNFVMSVHQIEHEVSGMFDSVAHGAGLAVIWPEWAMNAYMKDIKRFSDYAYQVMKVDINTPKEIAAKEGILRTSEFFKSLGMPTTLKELNVPQDSLEALADNFTFHGKRVLEDIITVDYDMCLKILKGCYE